MLTLPAAQEAHLALITGAPWQAKCMTIAFDAGVLRLTDADGDVTITGVGTFTASRTRAQLGAVRDGSETTGVLRLEDENLTYSAIIENEGWSGKSVVIRVVSGGAGTYAEAEAPVIYRQRTSDYRDEVNALVLGLVEVNTSDSHTGRVTVDQAFKHAPVAGTVVSGQGVTWTIARGPGGST